MTMSKSQMSCIALAVVCTLGGCSPPDTPQARVPADGIESLPPDQIQRALQQLSSRDARQQQNGLEFAEQFPSLASTHPQILEHLAQNGANPTIKKKAAQLLEPSK
jgi:uncharacterized protein YidB (DUF937 family)